MRRDSTTAPITHVNANPPKPAPVPAIPATEPVSRAGNRSVGNVSIMVPHAANDSVATPIRAMLRPAWEVSPAGTPASIPAALITSTTLREALRVQPRRIR